MSVYSEDLRLRVVGAVKAGVGSYRKLSELFDVNKNTIVEWVKLDQQSGSVSAQKCGPKPQDLAVWRKRIEKLLRDQPDGTLEEWVQSLAKEGFRTSPAALCRWCRRLNITLKKRPFGLKNKIRQR